MEQQAAQGLMCAFIVLLRDENMKNHHILYKDYVLLLQQWEIPQPKMGEVYTGLYKPNKFDRNPNFFTTNGKSFPDTSPLYTKFGQLIKIRFINKSSNSHSMHIH